MFYPRGGSALLASFCITRRNAEPTATLVDTHKAGGILSGSSAVSFPDCSLAAVRGTLLADAVTSVPDAVNPGVEFAVPLSLRHVHLPQDDGGECAWVVR